MHDHEQQAASESGGLNMADIFLSYSRRDSDFVTRLNDALAARGKEVWLDLQGIADSEVFPDAIRRAIEESEAFVFAISPASVSSTYCGHEVDYAAELGKRIVPVLYEAVSDEEIPTVIAERNWIPFLDTGEFERSVDRVVVAVDTDLEYRREHTRWLVKAAEWDREGRDHSFLLRGSELAAAEGWLAGAQTDADPPPTELQRSYLLASRQSNLRRQRRFAVGGLTVGAVAIALLVFALISRSQAVTAETTASSRALAAESQNLLASDPETSVLVATKALEESPTPDALYAVRQALDHSTVERALPLARTTTDCQPVARFVGNEPLILRAAEGGQLTAYRASTGTVAWNETVAQANSCVLALDPSRDLAAVAGARAVELIDPSTGTVSSVLKPAALSGPPVTGSPAVMSFSQDGTQLAVLTDSGQIELWNMTTGTGRVLSATFPVLDDVAFVADGSELALGTQEGTFLVVDGSTGQVVRTLTVGVPGDSVELAADQTGSTVAVADSTISSRRPTVVTMWNTATWTQQSTLASFGEIGVDTMAFSPSGDRLAIGEADGAASVWSLSHQDELAPLLGQTADVDAVSFSPDAASVLVSSLDGSARIYRATGPGLGTVGLDTGVLTPDSFTWDTHSFSTVLMSDAGTCVPSCQWTTWSWPGGGQIEQHTLSTDPDAIVATSGATVAVATPHGSGPTWTVTVSDGADLRPVRTLDDVPLGPVGTVTPAFMGMSDNGRFLELALAGATTKGALLRTYDLPTGRITASRLFATPTTAVCGVNDSTTSTDGSVDVLLDFCGHIWTVDLADHSALRLLNSGGRASALQLNTAGTQLAVSSWDGTADVFDPRTGRRLFQLIGSAGMTDIAYSPGDRYIVTTSVSGDVQTWSADDGRLLRSQSDPSGTSLITFASPNRFSTLDNDGDLRVWDVCSDCQDPGPLLQMARHAVVTPLTAAESQQSAQS
jgi:WD40 repeat protein